MTTNREFLLQVLDHPAFIAGDIDTHFIDRHLQEALGKGVAEVDMQRAAMAAALAEQQQRDRERLTLVPDHPFWMAQQLPHPTIRGIRARRARHTESITVTSEGITSGLDR